MKIKIIKNREEFDKLKDAKITFLPDQIDYMKWYPLDNKPRKCYE